VFDVDKDLENTMNSILTSSIPFGAMIGSSTAGLLLDRVSRKNALLITDLLGIIGTLIS
jgi:MFS family permease